MMRVLCWTWIRPHREIPYLRIWRTISTEKKNLNSGKLERGTSGTGECNDRGDRMTAMMNADKIFGFGREARSRWNWITNECKVYKQNQFYVDSSPIHKDVSHSFRSVHYMLRTRIGRGTYSCCLRNRFHVTESEKRPTAGGQNIYIIVPFAWKVSGKAC